MIFVIVFVSLAVTAALVVWLWIRQTAAEFYLEQGYSVAWSAEAGNYVARCARHPSLSYGAASAEGALNGIRALVREYGESQ